MAVHVLILAIAMAGTGCAKRPATSPVMLCSNPARLYPSPDDCRKFIRCVNRRPVTLTCPPRTAFDPDTQICAWKDEMTGCRADASVIAVTQKKLANLFDKKPSSVTRTLENVGSDTAITKDTETRVKGSAQVSSSWGNATQTTGTSFVTKASADENNRGVKLTNEKEVQAVRQTLEIDLQTTEPSAAGTPGISGEQKRPIDKDELPSPPATVNKPTLQSLQPITSVNDISWIHRMNEGSTTDSTLDSTTDSTLDSATDSTLDSATNSTLDSATDSTLDSATDSTLDSATDSTLDSVTDSTLDRATDSSLDSTTESTLDSAIDSTTDSSIDSAADSTLDSATDSTLSIATDSTLSRAADSTLDSTLDSITDSTLDSITDSTLDSITDSTLDSITDSTLDSITDSTETQTILSKKNFGIGLQQDSLGHTWTVTDNTVIAADTVTDNTVIAADTVTDNTVIAADTVTDNTMIAADTVTDNTVIAADTVTDNTMIAADTVTDNTMIAADNPVTVVYVETTQGSDSEVTQDPDSEATQSSDSGMTQDPDIEATQSSDSEVTQDPDSEATQSSDSGMTQDPDIEATQSSDSEVTQDPDSEATQSSDSGVTQDPDIEATQSSDSEVTQDPDIEATQSSDSELTQDPDIKANQVSDSDVTYSSENEVIQGKDSKATQDPKSGATDDPNSAVIKSPDNNNMTFEHDINPTNGQNELHLVTQDITGINGDQTSPTNGHQSSLINDNPTSSTNSNPTSSTKSDQTSPTNSDQTFPTNSDQTSLTNSDQTFPTNSDQTSLTNSDQTSLTNSDQTSPTDSDQTSPRQNSDNDIAGNIPGYKSALIQEETNKYVIQNLDKNDPIKIKVLDNNDNINENNFEKAENREKHTAQADGEEIRTQDLPSVSQVIEMDMQFSHSASNAPTSKETDLDPAKNDLQDDKDLDHKSHSHAQEVELTSDHIKTVSQNLSDSSSNQTSDSFEGLEQIIAPYMIHIDRKSYELLNNNKAKGSLSADTPQAEDSTSWINSKDTVLSATLKDLLGKIVNRDTLDKNQKSSRRWYDQKSRPDQFSGSISPVTVSETATPPSSEKIRPRSRPQKDTFPNTKNKTLSYPTPTADTDNNSSVTTKKDTIYSSNLDPLPSHMTFTSNHQTQDSLLQASTQGDKAQDSLLQAVTQGDKAQDSLLQAGTEGDKAQDSLLQAGTEGDKAQDSLLQAGTEGDKAQNSLLQAGTEGDKAQDSLLQAVTQGDNTDALNTTQDKNMDTQFLSAPYMVTGLTRPFHCPEPEGHFPDPNNCAVFYHCSEGQAYRRDCSPGQVFHSGVLSCVSTSLAPPCSNTYTDRVQEDEIFAKSLCKDPSGVYRDEFSCTHYFECTNGWPIRRKCMTGTVFDEVVGKCSWSKYVPGCEQEVTIDAEKAAGLDTFQCPRDGYFREPGRCDMYYLCAGGMALRMTCDPGTSFDVNLNMCAWSSRVDGCSQENMEISDQAWEDILLSGDPQKHVTETVAVTDDLQFQEKDQRCLEEDGVYPDTEDCSTYYTCIGHVAKQARCPLGMGYDILTGLCLDKTRITRCMTGNNPELTTYNPDVMNRADYFTCPEAHGLYSDPYNCSFFIHCFKRVAYRHQCLPGTVFSSENAACTWQDLVPECQVTAEPKSTSENTVRINSVASSHKDLRNVEIEPYQQQLPNRGISKNKAQPVDLREFKCPDVEDSFFRDRVFCDIFHRCVLGSRFTFTCPAGTFFRLDGSFCDFREAVTDCSQDGIRLEALGSLPEVALLPQPILYQQTKARGLDFSVVSSDADPAPCPESSGLFPHPRNCSQFLFCAHFVPLVLTCPDKLFYNHQTLTCDKAQCLQPPNFDM